VHEIDKQKPENHNVDEIRVNQQDGEGRALLAPSAQISTFILASLWCHCSIVLRTVSSLPSAYPP